MKKHRHGTEPKEVLFLMNIIIIAHIYILSNFILN